MDLNGQDGHHALAAVEIPPDVSHLLAVISERERAAEKKAAAWQRVGTLAIIGSLGLIGAVIYQRSQLPAIPYPVGVTEDARVVVLAPHPWMLEEGVIRAKLESWLDSYRGFGTDSVQNLKRRNAAWEMSLPVAQKQMLLYFEALPLKRVGQVAVSVKIERLEPAGGRTWEVQFREEATNLKTVEGEVHQYSGFITVATKPPTVTFKNGVVVTQTAELTRLGLSVESFTVDERPSSKGKGK
jgi:type IV secretory pathway TrbF-like protein